MQRLALNQDLHLLLDWYRSSPEYARLRPPRPDDANVAQQMLFDAGRIDQQRRILYLLTGEIDDRAE